MQLSGMSITFAPPHSGYAKLPQSKRTFNTMTSTMDEDVCGTSPNTDAPDDDDGKATKKRWHRNR